MDEKEKEIKGQEQQNFEFMKEQIKERPINKKKLVRRMIITASMAVLFGLIACVTVLGLEPVISNWLYPQEPAENITFPEEEEEILPQDMALDDEELHEDEKPELVIMPEIDALQTYEDSYDKLKELSQDISASLVMVTGITSDMDWFANTYENKDQTTGLLIADNKKEYLILSNRSTLDEVESIQVTMCDGKQLEASIKSSDPVVGLCVLSIPHDAVPLKTQEAIKIARLGSSNSRDLPASPVIALGSPMGITGSVMYGMITSSGNTQNLPDRHYTVMTTDIYGSNVATGILANLNGEIVGVINQNYNDTGLENMISAIGISELKPTIERMSNGLAQPRVGICGMNVTDEASEELAVPIGAYITEVEMDSPAMDAGIQSGDVLIRIGQTYIKSYDEYVKILRNLKPGEEELFVVKRQGQEDYASMEFTVMIGEVQ